MTQPQWTANEDARLERLWNQRDPELSVIEIGRQCGRTKNSVVGRAHRIGLSPRRSPINPDPAPRPSRAVRVAAGVSTLPQLPSETR